MKHLTKRSLLCILLAAALCLTLGTACGKKTEKYSLRVVNRTGTTLGKIYICGETSDKQGGNLLHEDLTDGDTFELSVPLAPDELEKGLAVTAVDKSGRTLGTVHGVMASGGDHILLYIEDGMLAAAVNLSYEQATVSIPEQDSDPVSVGIRSAEEIAGTWRHVTDVRNYLRIEESGKWEYYEGTGLKATGTLEFDETTGGMMARQEEERDLVYFRGNYLSFASFGYFAQAEN